MSTRAIDFACRLVAAEMSDNKIAVVSQVQRGILLYVCAGLHEPDHIAESMDRTTSAVTNLCRRLCDDGLLEKKRGAFEAYRLTKRGEEYVSRLLRIAEGKKALNSV